MEPTFANGKVDMTIQEEVEYQRDLKLEAYKTIDALREQVRSLTEANCELNGEMANLVMESKVLQELIDLREENKRLRQGQNALKKVLHNKEIHKHAIVCPDSCGGVLEATDIIGEAKCNECGTYFTID